MDYNSVTYNALVARDGAVPEISTIIPVYNTAEAFFRKCIDSVLSQTFLNFEIIIIDDGSTNGIEKLCDEYAAKDKRIVVIHQENKGITYAENAGLKAAKGKYIAFIDSDDFIDGNYFEVLRNEIQKKNTTLVLSGVNCFEMENNSMEIIYSGNNWTPAHTFMRNGMKHSYNVKDWWWGKLYKKELIDKYKISVIPSKIATQANDYWFVYTYCHYSKRKTNVVSTDGAFYNYRSHSNSSSRILLGGGISTLEYTRDAIEAFELAAEMTEYKFLFRAFKHSLGNFAVSILYNLGKETKKIFLHTILSVYRKSKKIYVMFYYLCVALIPLTFVAQSYQFYLKFIRRETAK